MSEKVKLVVCNEPQNCETVKELEQHLKEIEDDAEKWITFVKTMDFCPGSDDPLVWAKETKRWLHELHIAEGRIRAASNSLEKLKQTLRCYHEWDSPALRDIWQCFNELEADLGGKAEEECISRTLMKECGYYPKKEAKEP